MKMSLTVGVREFRRDLAEYIDGDEPVTVTRHGRRVGVFVPARDDHAEAIAAYQAAVGKLQALMEQSGVGEDELVAEFDAARRAAREEARAVKSAS
jgi:prevent-host-death family protein